MTVTELMAQLATVGTQLRDGGDTEVEVWFCEGETMRATRAVEVEHAETAAEDAPLPQECVIIRVEAHLDPSMRRVRSRGHGLAEELRKMLEDDGGGEPQT